MRSHPVRILKWGALALLCGQSPAVAAEPPSPRMTIEAPAALKVGTVIELTVHVTTVPGQEHPLLLTPRVDGVAVDVVRGRLLRSDARARSPGKLRFALPLRVLEPGTAIVRIDALTYRCAARCEPAHFSASVTLIAEP